jgi:hypothetical protein
MRFLGYFFIIKKIILPQTEAEHFFYSPVSLLHKKLFLISKIRVVMRY